MSSTDPFVKGARWALAATIVLVTAALVIDARLSTGFGRRGTQYLIMGLWSIAQVVIPAIIIVDLSAHLIHAAIKASRKEFRLAGEIAMRAIAADGLLLLLTLAAALAILNLAM